MKAIMSRMNRGGNMILSQIKEVVSKKYEKEPNLMDTYCEVKERI